MAWFHALAGGITLVDTGFTRPRFDASYLVIEAGRAAFIDTGPNSAVPRLLAALDANGLSRDAVDWVIPTHVHLDHAGGAGSLMQHLPSAKLLIHPRGARHMLDPTVLMQGVRAVYGRETADRDYGELLPIPEQRIVTTHDEMVIALAGRPLRVIHTPGHAKHHFCVWDEATRGWFTGDTFGIAYPELDTAGGRYINPATAPTQFEPEALHASVTRLLEARPACMYLTHFGAITDADRMSVQYLRQVDSMVTTARTLATAPDRHARLKDALADLYLGELSAMGSRVPLEVARTLLELDIELNAQGLGVWLDSEARKVAP
jgi:glyoxylase-like metal-dependent hydrolase (beta-lactamase superfamily II)